MTPEQLARLVEAGEIVGYEIDRVTGEITDIKWLSDRDEVRREYVLTMDGRYVEVPR